MGITPEQIFFKKQTNGQQVHEKGLNLTKFREMQIETTMSNHLIPKMKDKEEGTLAPSVECKLVQLLQRTEQRFLKKIKNRNYHVIQHPTSEYLSKRNEITILKRRDICTLMFTAAIFTIAKTRKRPKCPVMNEWVKKMWCIHTHINIIHNEILFSHKKRRKFCHLQHHS